MNKEVIDNILRRIRVDIYETIGEMDGKHYASAAFHLGVIVKDLESALEELDKPELDRPSLGGGAKHE